MADMTLNEVREGLALAIEQKNAEGIQLFTNIYSAMEARKNKKTPMERDINITTEEKNLSSLIGFKSQIKYNSKGQGYIKIFYENLEQYDFIVKKIKN